MIDSDLLARCEDSPGWAADEIERLRSLIEEMTRSISGAVGVDPQNFWESVNCVDSMKDEIERLRERVDES